MPPTHPKMNKPDDQAAPVINEAEILAGGMTLPGAKNRNGEDVVVFIRKVAFLKLQPLALSWGNFEREAEVYTGMVTAQVENLSDETQQAVIKEGRRLNFTALSAYMEAQEQTVKAMGGGSQQLADLMKVELEKAAAAQKSPSQQG